MKLLFIRATGFYPYFNQAIEATLLDKADDETEILYLWQNDKTVFIGKHQNAFTECKTSYIEADGGYIARRISGGGAVYHDKGNINFTFLSSKKNYDKQKNFAIMISAMKKLGFDAELSGRNDVLIGGRKFSGNAFYRGAESCFHHGTVLINADNEKLSSYLNVSKAKLDSKGVKSVVSRIINLRELRPVTADDVACAMKDAFEAYYGAKVCEIKEQDLFGEKFDKKIAFFSDPEWIKGDDIFYDARLERRFGWGTADIRLGLSGNIVVKAKIYSDCLDVDEVASKEQLLLGADIYKGKQGVNDIIDAFKEQKNGF